MERKEMTTLVENNDTGARGHFCIVSILLVRIWLIQRSRSLCKGSFRFSMRHTTNNKSRYRYYSLLFEPKTYERRKNRPLLYPASQTPYAIIHATTASWRTIRSHARVSASVARNTTRRQQTNLRTRSSIIYYSPLYVLNGTRSFASGRNDFVYVSHRCYMYTSRLYTVSLRQV